MNQERYFGGSLGREFEEWQQFKAEHGGKKRE